MSQDYEPWEWQTMNQEERLRAYVQRNQREDRARAAQEPQFPTEQLRLEAAEGIPNVPPSPNRDDQTGLDVFHPQSKRRNGKRVYAPIVNLGLGFFEHPKSSRKYVMYRAPSDLVWTGLQFNWGVPVLLPNCFPIAPGYSQSQRLGSQIYLTYLEMRLQSIAWLPITATARNYYLRVLILKDKGNILKPYNGGAAQAASLWPLLFHGWPTTGTSARMSDTTYMLSCDFMARDIDVLHDQIYATQNPLMDICVPIGLRLAFDQRWNAAASYEDNTHCAYNALYVIVFPMGSNTEFSSSYGSTLRGYFNYTAALHFEDP